MSETAPSPTPQAARPSPLRRRIQSSGIAVVGGYGLGQLLRLASNLILTRLLLPEAFGLIAIAMSINLWSAMMTDVGINASVIRSKKGTDPLYLRTAWTMQVMRNATIFVIIVITASGLWLAAQGGALPPDSVLADPRLWAVTVLTGVQVPINGFISVNRDVASRDLAMGRVVGMEIMQQVFASAVTIYFAANGYGVWSIVIGMNAGAFLNAIVSHRIFKGPRMGFALNREYALEILNFGKWLIIASFFSFLAQRGDQIVLGYLMPSERFGFFAIAAIWLSAGSYAVNTVISRVYYPAVSEILRDRPQNLEMSYRKIRLIADGAVIAIAFGAFLLAEPVFRILYPDNYQTVGSFIRLASPIFLLIPLKLIDTIVLAAGDSRNYTLVTVIGGSAMLVILPVVYIFAGEKAAIVAVACMALTTAPVIWRNGARHMKIDPLVEGRTLVALAVLVALIFLT